MGEGRRGPAFPRCGRGRVRGTLSLGTEEAQAPSGSRPGRRPLAVTALVVSVAVLTLLGTGIVLVHRSTTSGST
jgi:hypothetical protein